MNFKNYLKGVLVLVIVEIISYTVFTLFTQPKLVVSSGILSEISRKIAVLSNHMSDSTENSYGSANGVSKLPLEFFELSNNVSKLSVAVSELFYNFSTLSREVSKLSNDKTVNSLETSTSANHKSSQLYVFGGFDGNNYLSSASHYNSSTGNWEATTAMPTAKYFSCGVVIGTKVYLFGGSSGEKYHSSAEVYDCETGTYSQYRSLPSPRDACGAAVLNNFIYVAGGYSGWKRLSSVIRYDILTTRRRIVSSFNYPRTGHQLVELSGYLYVIGGYLSIVEKYNPTTNQWSEASRSNYAHFDFGAAVQEGKIYVCSHLGFEVYSPDMDRWKTLTPLNAHKGRTLVSMNNKLWALGGNGTKSVFTYDAVAEKWNQQPDMDVGRKFHTSFVVNH